MKKELSPGTNDEQRTDADFSTSASVEANPMLAAVDSKNIGHVLMDSLVGRKIRVFKKEYEDYEYKEYDSKPKFNYMNGFIGFGYESVICEIVELIIKDTKEYRIKLIMSDNGKLATLSVRLSDILQFVQ